MTEILNHLIEQLNSSVFILIGMLVGMFWLIYKVSEVVTNWKNRESDITQLKNKWDEDMPYIKERVNLMYSKIFNGVLQNASPITLTDVGNKISKEIDAKQIVEQHLEVFKQQVDSADPQNAYQLQQVCLNVVDVANALNKEEMSRAQEQAFNTGLLLDNVLAVVAIFLRDKLMLEKGWPQTDIDKHESVA